jgi:flagellar biosynthetic protein FliQ
MDSGTLLHLMYGLFMVVAKISAPLLLASLIVGVLISLFQAVTQINDSTLSFLPKLIAVALTLWIALPWITQEIVSYTQQTFELLERMPR